MQWQIKAETKQKYIQLKVTKEAGMDISTKPTLAEIIPVLTACGLPHDDIHASFLENFITVKSDGNVMGVAGLQLSGIIGLLRSVAVIPEFRSKGIGRQLVTTMEQHAARIGIRQLFLMTNDASEFFAKHGYRKIDRKSAPQEIQETTQFKSSCCCSATVMSKNIAG